MGVRLGLVVSNFFWNNTNQGLDGNKVYWVSGYANPKLGKAAALNMVATPTRVRYTPEVVDFILLDKNYQPTNKVISFLRGITNRKENLLAFDTKKEAEEHYNTGRAEVKRKIEDEINRLIQMREKL